MKQKRLMLLGGLRYLLPVIEAAHKQGYYVITADYLPENIAHKYSDEFCNISVIDKDVVLEAARRLEIDGIMSFAVDPGVVSASYVQEQMHLPSFGPYESVCILQNKDRFRDFLIRNGFNAPWAKGFGSVEEAMLASCMFHWPCIVKPTDSAGSKGVTRVDSLADLRSALEYAFASSIKKKVIVEEFIEKKGCSSDTDCFALNGKLRFVSFSSQRFDEKSAGKYVPAAYSWPSTMTMQEEKYLASEIQRLLTLLHMQTSIYNVETRIGANGKPYIMEMSPRGGGNRLAEMLRYATGVDLVTACTRAAVGDSVELPANEDMNPCSYNGHWAEIILHAGRAGNFTNLLIDNDKVNAEIMERDIWVKEGQEVETFNGANNAIGTLVVRFKNRTDLAYAMSHIDTWVKVGVI